MLKKNNDWLYSIEEKGLYFGCYNDKLTVKIGQTLKGFYKRAHKIDLDSGKGFSVQYYIPFANLWEDKKKNTIFALAMEDLVHDWMTQFCNTKDFHKYRGEDHYECSVKGCERFFDYFENHEKEITEYFTEAGEKIHSIIDNFNYPKCEDISVSELAINILRIYNKIEEPIGERLIDRSCYIKSWWKHDQEMKEWEKRWAEKNKTNITNT